MARICRRQNDVGVVQPFDEEVRGRHYAWDEAPDPAAEVKA